MYKCVFYVYKDVYKSVRDNDTARDDMHIKINIGYLFDLASKCHFDIWIAAKGPQDDASLQLALLDVQHAVVVVKLETAVVNAVVKT